MESTPLPREDCHPGLDESILLDLNGHTKFQMLMGMLQWLVTIGCPDQCNLVSSLNHFGAAPREYYLDLVLRLFSYVKRTNQRDIVIDSSLLECHCKFPDYKFLAPDFLKDYPDTKEETANHFPQAFGPVLETTIILDSDHSHDQNTCPLLTDFLAYRFNTSTTDEQMSRSYSQQYVYC